MPREFIGIVSAKIALYAVMALLLRTAWHAETALRANPTAEAGSTAATVEIHYLMKLYGFSVGAGALALGLGLWLSGT